MHHPYTENVSNETYLFLSQSFFSIFFVIRMWKLSTQFFIFVFYHLSLTGTELVWNSTLMESIYAFHTRIQWDSTIWILSACTSRWIFKVENSFLQKWKYLPCLNEKFSNACEFEDFSNFHTATDMEKCLNACETYYKI